MPEPADKGGHLLWSFDKNYLLPVAKLSTPTVIQQCVPSLSSVVLTSCVNNFGIVAMASHGIVNKLDMV